MLNSQWTEEELDQLKNLWFDCTPSEVYSLIPSRKPTAIFKKATKMKFPRSKETKERIAEAKRNKIKSVRRTEYSNRWTDEELSLLKRLWFDHTPKEVYALISSRSAKAIEAKATEMELPRSDGVIKRLEFRRWTDDDLSKLRTLWLNHTPKEVFDLMPSYSVGTILKKVSELKIERSHETKLRITECKQNLLKKRNIETGRERNYESAKASALKYKSKTEFYREDNSMYQYARENGLLDELCSHMTKGRFNYSESFLFECIRVLFPVAEVIRNSRKIIPPYELDIYIDQERIAFEYDGSNWHEQRDVIARDAEKSQLCIESGIKLYRIKEVRERRNAPENDIIQSLDDLGFSARSIDIEGCKLRAFGSVYTDERIRDILSRYVKLKDVRENEPRLYNWICKMGLSDVYFSGLDRRVLNRNVSEVSAAIDSVSTATEFRAKYGAMYVAMKRYPEKYANELAKYKLMRAGHWISFG